MSSAVASTVMHEAPIACHLYPGQHVSENEEGLVRGRAHWLWTRTLLMKLEYTPLDSYEMAVGLDRRVHRGTQCGHANGFKLHSLHQYPRTRPKRYCNRFTVAVDHP